MTEYFVYYTESTIICLILFAIMLGHDVFNVDRQEKMIKYDHALVAFMLYFISDEFWAAVLAGHLPRTGFTVFTTNFLNCVFMGYITYTWLQYAMAVVQAPGRDVKRNRFAAALPLILSAFLMLLICLTRPQLLFDSEYQVTMLYNAFLVVVPIIYIVAILFYTVGKARGEKNPDQKKSYLYVGFFPLMVVVGGLFQILVLPDVPVFCYSCTVLMLIFNMRQKDTQISLDPLTGLNNRGQLNRYVSQDSSLFREGLRTFAAMIDVNDFKHINDNYGHAEGDHALVIIADALRHAAGSMGFPVFIARYGGDEYMIIMHCDDGDGPEKLANEIRRQIKEISAQEGIPYTISIAYGYEELRPGGETFEECLERADHDLYADKARQKGL